MQAEVTSEREAGREIPELLVMGVDGRGKKGRESPELLVMGMDGEGSREGEP